MEEWKEYRLGDIATVQTGPFGSQLHNKDYVLRGTPIVTVEHLGAREFSTQNLPCVSDADKERLGKYSLKKGDIVFSRVGSVDRCSYVSIKEEGWLFSGRCLRVRSDISVYSLFLYYYLQQEEVKQSIRNIAVGATMPSINTKLLSEIKVSIPSSNAQHQIASVLQSLDDKIEVNRRINENLEQQAQALFKSWFVDFEPFRDGEFVESELGMIPKGWRVKSIGELPLLVTDYVANGSFASLKENVKLYQEEEYAVFIRNTDLKSGEFRVYVDKHSYDFLSKSRLYGGEIIISNVGDVGSVFLCPHLNKPMTLGNNIIMVKADDDITNTYLFLLFKWSYGQGLIQSITGGSAQPKFNKTDFKSLKIIMPSNNILDNYGVKLKSMMNIIETNNEENIRLATLRDTLLPKLMSGELKVNDVD